MLQLKFLVISLLLCSFLSFEAEAQPKDYAYKGNVKIVLGDVKQRFIHDQIHTEQQVMNLIKGLEAFKVTGVRVPIFPEGLEPNKAMLDLFIKTAVEKGYKIYANPALWSGARRIANRIFETGKKQNLGPAVKGMASKTDVLIQRIKAFAQAYPCDWICPFNEDGKPNEAWSTAQINQIYADLSSENALNGAQLTGPCTWGIPAAIEIFETTKVPAHISIATSHNLGFNHSHWAKFIELAKGKGLSVWDSEVNHFEKNGNKSRLVAAVEAGVDGLILYNSGNMTDLHTGEISNGGKAMLDIYYKNASASKEKANE